MYNVIKCLHGKTQNENESFNSVVKEWQNKYLSAQKQLNYKGMMPSYS